MQLNINATLQNGKYKLIAVLGQGGFGITYLATQESLGRKVAIKEFFMKDFCNRDAHTPHVSIVSDGAREQVERFRQKFLKEARTIASLDHPHIIRIYDVFEENGTAYYVMEYIDGGSLKELVTHRGALPEAEALDYATQLTEALRYLHSHHILHLDLKPANVLLKDKHTAVLIDFGVSKRYDTEGGQTSSTPAGISKGYAPLEQYKTGGLEHFQPSTDLYSLGATLYTLLTGKIPPEASDVNNDGLPPLPAQISARTAQAIVKAMSPRPKDRPQNVDAWDRLLTEAPQNDEPEITLVKNKKQKENKENNKDKKNDEKLLTTGRSNKLKIATWTFLGIVILAAFTVLFTDRKGSTSIHTLQAPVGDSCLLYQPFQNEQGKWGFIGIGQQFEKKIIPPKYDDADLFSNGRARVKLNGLYGYIDKNGVEIIPPRYKSASDFKLNCAFVKTDDKYALIDICGKEITPPIFDEYEPINLFEKGLNAVRTGDKWGFINKNGQWVIPAQYDHVSNFRSGLAKVYNAPDDFYINPQGKTVYPPLFDEWLFDPGDGTCIAFKEEGKYGFADSTGQVIIQPQYRMAYSFSEGLAYVEDIQGGTGFINLQGEYVIPPDYQFNGPTYCKDGRVIVCQNSLQGFMDKDGKKITPIKYDYVNSFENNFARIAYKDEARMKSIYMEYTYGYINRDGKEIIPCLYEELRYLPDFALFCARRSDSVYYIDTIGNIKATIRP